MLFTQTRFTDDWSAHAEIQYRSYEVQPNLEQLLIRAGINYHVNDRTLATAGYANISNYAFDSDLQPGVQVQEHRIWQQLQFRSNVDRVVFLHRYRFEQRWIESGNISYYRNRGRALLRVTVPLNMAELKQGAVFLSAYDEMFLQLTSSPFDRNRLYAALGFQLRNDLDLQLGVLWQTVGAITKPYLQVGVSYNADVR